MKKKFLALALALVMLLAMVPVVAQAEDNTCGNGLTWSFDSTTGTLTISKTGEGDGAMADYRATTYVGDVAPWSGQRASITRIVIENDVTSIGSYAFCYCSGLTSVTIPSNVKSIGDGAFYTCTSLTSITFGENSKLTSIGYSAFDRCESLTSITIPDGVTSIGDNAFQSCKSLTSVRIPDGVTSIGGGAFCMCTSLTSVTIPYGVTSIGSAAFGSCTGLTSIEIPGSVKSIESGAFQGCEKLPSVKIPSSVTSIGHWAFEYSGLTSVTFEGTPPETIGDSAFRGCNISSVTVPKGTDMSNLTAAGIPEDAAIQEADPAPAADTTVHGRFEKVQGYCEDSFSVDLKFGSLDDTVKKIRLTHADVVKEYVIANMTPDANGRYVCTIPVYAYHMNVPITAELLDENDAVVNIGYGSEGEAQSSIAYSFMTYLNNINDPALTDVVASIITYGEKAIAAWPDDYNGRYNPDGTLKGE